MTRPRLRPPTQQDGEFIFELAALADLRWSVATRFLSAMTPSAVLTTVLQASELGYIVADSAGADVGVIGFIDPDVGSQALWLDGIARPDDCAGWTLVRAAVPVVIDEAARSGTVRHVYYDEYTELNCSLISGEGSEGSELWTAEVTIPRFVNINGVWCTRVTHCLQLNKWHTRL